MKKQFIQFGVVVVILVLCIGGYFGLSKYFSNKENKDKSETVIAFEMENYKNATGITYMNSGKKIRLTKNNGEWKYADDSSVKLSDSVIEGEMLSQFAKVEAVEKIDQPENISDYGFDANEKGKIESATNTIAVTDSNGKIYTLYIGMPNPYDSTQYYMMVEGDNAVYAIDSALPDTFLKSVEDITEEETTVEETLVKETTSTKETENN